MQVYGNSHEEIENELSYLLHGGYLLDSQYYKRDEFTVFGGRRTAKLEHTNPDQTPEAYREQLREWSLRRRSAAQGEKS
ncbi:hypothetical protein CH249_14165 [Rhodococcus sp. 05-2255-3B1]|nr:hypothetical protein CH249_14165 [Rhodococcus sp. 05-2255-3B1]